MNDYLLKKDSFYPTPKHLALRMKDLIKGNPTAILEPCAGKGDLLNPLVNEYNSWSRKENISTIEIDPDLRAILKDNGYKVIDENFLTFSGPDKFDLILMNPPFDEGEYFLLKAIDILYSGQIICLLNANTIRNPHTNVRKELFKKLNDLKADIQFIEHAFLNAERETDVEIALVNIVVHRKVEDDLFQGATDTATDNPLPDIEPGKEVSTKKHVEELVAEYNQIIKIGTDTILNYYRNYKKIGEWIGLNCVADKKITHSSAEDMTKRMQHDFNQMIKSVRITFWRKTLELKEVKERLTSKKRDEFEEQLKQQTMMDFTEHNIRSFVINFLDGYEKTLTEAVMWLFKVFSQEHCYSQGLYDDNIHYFNGWKTNDAFKVKQKVIIPVYGHGYGSTLINEYTKKWEVGYGVKPFLDDIDKVMNFFDGLTGYYGLTEAIQHAFARGESKRIESTYFTVTCYKKGTIHLTFKSEDILRRFNTVACRDKNWLPHDYGKKRYEDMNAEEKAVVANFEGEESYKNHVNLPLFAPKNMLALPTF